MSRWIACAAGVVVWVGAAWAVDWDLVPVVEHSTFQAVNADGTPAYDGNAFPVRLVGIVLNNSEDWLNPAPDFDPGVTLFYMGGQAEVFVQALDRSTLDALGVELWKPLDTGGTAAWMGQNYGNHIMNQDASLSYTDAQWLAELGRLNLSGGAGVSDPIRAGDLVEIRARAGLHFQGKMNINEQHSTDPSRDFEIVRLVAGFGLPEATPLTLDALKTAEDTFVFDPLRAIGGERHQATLVTLRDVRLESADWSQMGWLTVNDGERRSLRVRLGYADGADWAAFGAGWAAQYAGEAFEITGVLNQTGSNTGGYYLVALTPDAFIPEPATLALLGAGMLTMLRRRRRHARR